MSMSSLGSEFKLSRLVLLLIVVFVLSACQSTPHRPIHGDDQGNAPVNVEQFNFDEFISLLQKYRTDSGQLDYAAWLDNKEDLSRLNAQVQAVAIVSPVSFPHLFPSREAARSYWVNAYNLLVIHAVLEYWPLDSVRDVKVSWSSHIIPGKGFFYDRNIVVGGAETNLYDFEKMILKNQKDPRLHFALNCASSSCPVLQPWEWTEEQLNQAAVDFINNEANVRVNKDMLFLSQIFKWYKKDFGDDIHQYLMQYAIPQLKQAILTAKQEKYPIEYIKYNWDLNDKNG